MVKGSYIYICTSMYVYMCVCVYMYTSGMIVKEHVFLIKQKQKIAYPKNEILRNGTPSKVFVLHLLLWDIKPSVNFRFTFHILQAFCCRRFVPVEPHVWTYTELHLSFSAYSYSGMIPDNAPHSRGPLFSRSAAQTTYLPIIPEELVFTPVCDSMSI